MIKKLFSNEEFLEKCINIHGNVFDYSKTIYTGIKSKIEIICRIHGIFEQRPDVHLQGAGCWKCSNCSSSIENDWLDYHSILPEERQITLKMNNTWYKVDAYVLKTNTIYEFYGDYWHGNPKIFLSTDINKCNKRLFGELYNKIINRENIFKNNNYNLITIWESDWIE